LSLIEGGLIIYCLHRLMYPEFSCIAPFVVFPLVSLLCDDKASASCARIRIHFSRWRCQFLPLLSFYKCLVHVSFFFLAFKTSSVTAFLLRKRLTRPPLSPLFHQTFSIPLGEFFLTAHVRNCGASLFLSHDPSF